MSALIWSKCPFSAVRKLAGCKSFNLGVLFTPRFELYAPKFELLHQGLNFKHQDWNFIMIGTGSGTLRLTLSQRDLDTKKKEHTKRG